MRTQRARHNGRELTFYEFFGVPEGAGDADLKAAYREACKRFHPDLNTDKARAEENFKALQRMWSVLGDPARRAGYDRDLAAERALRRPRGGLDIEIVFFSGGGWANTSTTFEWDMDD